MTVVGKFVATVRFDVLRIRLPKKTIKRRATTIKHDIFLRAADGSPFLQLQLCSFAHYPPGTWPEVSLGFNIPRNFDAKPTIDSLTHRLTAPPASPSISPTFIHYYKHCKTRISCLCLFVFVYFDFGNPPCEPDIYIESSNDYLVSAV